MQPTSARMSGITSSFVHQIGLSDRKHISSVQSLHFMETDGRSKERKAQRVLTITATYGILDIDRIWCNKLFQHYNTSFPGAINATASNPVRLIAITIIYLVTTFFLSCTSTTSSCAVFLLLTVRRILVILVCRSNRSSLLRSICNCHSSQNLFLPAFCLHGIT